MQEALSHEEAAAVRHDIVIFFGKIEEADYLLHHYHRWNQHGKVRDFETHLYTNNVKSGIDVLYRQLFAVLIEYTGCSSEEDNLFDIFTAFHNASWEKRIQMWRPRKPKLPRTEKTTPPAHEKMTPPAHDETTPPAHEKTTPPAHDETTPPAHDETTPPAHDETTSPVQGGNKGDDGDPCATIRQVLSDAERLAAAVHPMPSSSERLLLWGISKETVDAYSIDGSKKQLIRWVSVDQLRMRMALDENGKLLFGRCSVHWCWKRLHVWDTVVSYSAPRRMRIISGKEVVCEDCWIVLVNCLFFPSAHPLERKRGLLSEFQSLVAGLPWTEDCPTTKVEM
jgi:hypothetical protein